MSRSDKMVIAFVVLTTIIAIGTYSGMDGSGVAAFLAALVIAAVVSAVVVGLASLGMDTERKLRD